MAFVQYKFTLDNDTKGTLVVDKVDGWQEMELILERDKEFHSLIELVETPLIFYGPAREYILDVLDNQGIDDIVNITIELSTDEGATYTTVHNGVVALETVEEIYEGTQSHKIKAAINPNEFWQKFMNRVKTKVKVGDTTDLDGGTREAINSYTLNLPSQKIIQTYTANLGNSIDIGIGAQQYFVFEYSDTQTDEIENTFQLGSGALDNLPAWKVSFKFSGVLTFSNEFSITRNFGGTAPILEYYIQKNDDTATAYTKTLLVSDASGDINKYDYSSTINITKGDVLYIYGKNTNNGGGVITINNYSDLASPPTTSNISLNHVSVFDDTTTDAYKLHEVGNSISNLITGENGSFYSEYLGNTSTQIQSYGSDGGGSYYSLMGGINIRGKTLTEKPLYMSFMDWWNGTNPLLNLGLGYEPDSGSPEKTIIRVEELEHFYDNTPHTTISNIENLQREEAIDRYIKTVKVGFKKWKSEKIGALDDPQTVHDYATRFKTFGEDANLLSEFYGASIGIEATRRQSLEESEDWKLDDEIMIIALNRGLGSPTGLDYPELDEEYATITNLNNSETRYNTRLSPKRALLRNMNWLSSGLVSYAGASFKFVGGEGNYDMTSDLDDVDRGDYNNASIGENDNVAWDYGGSPLKTEQTPIFSNTIYRFNHAMGFSDYQSFVNNRKKSFQISTSTSDYINVFLLRLGYNPHNGMAEFETIKAYA